MRSSTSLFVLLLIAVLTLSILAIVGSAFAQSLPKPSVPEFSAKVVDNTLEVTIKNQPLTPYENGSYPSLYYGFKFKDINAMVGFWEYDPIFFVGSSTYGGYYNASDSEFTVVSLSIEGYDFPSGQIEIQAIALVGNQYPTDMQNGTVYGFEGEISDWSNTQTILISENQTPTPSPAATPTPTPPNMGPTSPPTREPLLTPEQLELVIVAAIAVAVIGAGLGLLIYLAKRK